MFMHLIIVLTIEIVNVAFILRINVREYRRGNQKWTIQGNWQHYAQAKTNNVNKDMIIPSIKWSNNQSITELKK